jgi:hypothetical protein
MAKRKEQTSRGVIKDLLAKAWEKAKGKPRSERGTKAEVEAREVKRLAEKTGRSAKQIRDIESGKRPGKNLLDPLKQIKRGRKVVAPPKEPKKITRAKKPIAPPKPPALPPRPKEIEVTLKGMIGPTPNFRRGDTEAPRFRVVTVSLDEDETADYYAALEKGDLEAAQVAIGAYFEGTGHPGHVESLSSANVEVLS